MLPPRFGGPPAAESCPENGLARGDRDGAEADGDVAPAGAPQAAAQKGGPHVEGGSEGRYLGCSIQAGQGHRWWRTGCPVCALECVVLRAPHAPATRAHAEAQSLALSHTPSSPVGAPLLCVWLHLG